MRISLLLLLGAAACAAPQDSGDDIEDDITAPQKLTVTLGGSGRVVSTPAGIDCPTTCVASFAPNSKVSLAPAPGAGVVFAGWLRDCDGAGACLLTLDREHEVEAAFAPTNQFVIALEFAGAGAGQVTIDGEQYTRPATLQQVSGQTVHIEAAAQAGSKFAGFAECNGAASCDLRADRSRTIRATFAPAAGGGATKWARRLVNLTAHADASAAGVALAGSLASTGAVAGKPVQGSIAVAKLDSSGRVRWAHGYGPATLAWDYPQAVALDAGGGVIVVGSYGSAIDFGGGVAIPQPAKRAAFIVSFTSAGAARWAKSFAPSGGDATLEAVKIGPDGGVFVAGGFKGAIDLGAGPLATADSYGLLAAKFGADGKLAWARGFGGNAGGSGTYVTAAVLDGSGNLRVAGATSGVYLDGLSCFDNFVAAFSPAGNALGCDWDSGDEFSGSPQISGIAPAAGGVLIAGYYSGFVTAPASFLRQGTTTDNAAWSQVYASTGSTELSAVAASPKGFVAGGSFQGNLTIASSQWLGSQADDAVVVAVDPTGKLRWARRFGRSLANVKSVAVLPDGSVIAAGLYIGGADMGKGELGGADGEVSGFVVKLAP